MVAKAGGKIHGRVDGGKHPKLSPETTWIPKWPETPVSCAPCRAGQGTLCVTRGRSALSKRELDMCEITQFRVLSLLKMQTQARLKVEEHGKENKAHHTFSGPKKTQDEEKFIVSNSDIAAGLTLHVLGQLLLAV